MNPKAIERLGVLAAARSSALMTQADMASIVGCSVPTLLKCEKNPDEASYEIVRTYYENVGQDGKKILEDYYSFSLQ